MAADAIAAMMALGKDRIAPPLVIPTNVQWTVGIGRDAVEQTPLRDSCIKHLGYDTMHRFLLAQLAPQLREALFLPLSIPGAVVAKYTDQWTALDMIEVDADAAEAMFGEVAEHACDEFGYVMPARFIRSLPRVLKLCMASDQRLTSGLLLFIASNTVVPQLPSVVEALLLARTKGKQNSLQNFDSDLLGLITLMQTKLLTSIRVCAELNPMVPSVVDLVLDITMGRISLLTFTNASEKVGKSKVASGVFARYNKNAASAREAKVAGVLAGFGAQ
jgi:hypothetical protein